ncbi:hypothetical protein ACE3I0_06370 [Enterobacter hormaechei subsp. hoffmannii]
MWGIHSGSKSHRAGLVFERNRVAHAVGQRDTADGMFVVTDKQLKADIGRAACICRNLIGVNDRSISRIFSVRCACKGNRCLA